MAFYSSGDLGISIIKETTLGVTPTTAPAVRHEIPIRQGASLPAMDSNDAQSTTMRPNRSGNGSRRGIVTGSGSTEMAFQQCAATDLLLQSALSGVWTDNVLVGGKTDTSFSVIAKAGADAHFTFGGCMVNSFTLEASAAGEFITSNFDYFVTKKTESATDNALTVTAIMTDAFDPSVQATPIEFMGTEVSDIIIDGTSLKYSSMSFEVTQDRAPRQVLGSSESAGISTPSNRQVTMTVTAYREDLSIDSLITGEPQNVQFEIGGLPMNTYYNFQMPEAIGSIPQDVTDDDLMVTFTFTAKYHEAIGSDIQIERFAPPTP